MNAKERFEIIVRSIEDMIQKNELTNREISDKAFLDADFPTEDREKNILFEFLFGKKVLEYISERRLMIGYKYLLNEKDKEKALRVAMDISGSASQPSYITKFKKVFNDLTPGEARRKGDISLYRPVPTWEGLIFETQKTDNMPDTVFGVSKEHFSLIKEALQLQDFYGFNDREREFAYSLYKDGISLDAAFKYISDYLAENKTINRDERLERDLTNEDVKYMYFDCDFGFDAIFIILLMKYLKQFDRPIRECDRHFLAKCFYYAGGSVWDLKKNYSTPTFQDKYDYYMEHADNEYTVKDFYSYLDYAEYYDYKTAFSKVIPGSEERDSFAFEEDEYTRFHFLDDDQSSVTGLQISKEDEEESYKYYMELEEYFYGIPGHDSLSGKRLTGYHNLNVEVFWTEFIKGMEEAE